MPDRDVPVNRAAALHVGGVAIEEVDLDAIARDDIVAWFAYDRIMKAECPSLPFELARYRVTSLPAFTQLRMFVGRDPDGAIVADGRALITHTENNRHVCQAHLSVRPDRRGRGVARHLLQLVADAAEAGRRRLLVAWSSDRAPAGEAFARRAGAERAHEFHAHRLLLSDLDMNVVRRWIADGPVRARDYGLISVDGRYPDELIDAVVDLRRVMITAPRGALELEPPIVTVDDMRDIETNLLGLGTKRWSLFARHEPTGEIVGFTEVGYHASNPKSVQQYGTAVRPSHRGHGLGRWLKAAMLERLVAERPGVEDVRTGNADSNDAMLAINRTLGFKPWIAASAWQVSVARVRRYLAQAAVAS